MNAFIDAVQLHTRKHVMNTKSHLRKKKFIYKIGRVYEKNICYNKMLTRIVCTCTGMTYGNTTQYL